MNSSKVAIVYDWADTHYGGAEKVLLALQQIYPQATLVTAFADYEHVSWIKHFPQVVTTYLQRWPRWLLARKSLMAIFLPAAFEALDLRAFDLIISVSSFASKGIITNPGQVHLCYLLTPTRFLWSHQQQYLSCWQAWLVRPIMNYLQRWDLVAAQRPDQIFAISQLVAARCQTYYHRRPDGVIYPDLLSLQPDDNPALRVRTRPPYLLYVGRLVKYKRADLVILAANTLSLPLKIVGTGPEWQQLHQLVNNLPNRHLIEFCGNLSSKQLKMYYNNALALVAPGQEDFGINLLEANQAGTWVIANARSGAMELLDERMAIAITTETEAAVVDSIKQLADKGKTYAAKKSQLGGDFSRRWRDTFVAALAD